MRTRLTEEYEKFKHQTHIPPDLSERLSAPLMLHIPTKWINAKERILLIGQETLGWGFKSGEYYDWPYDKIHTFTDFKKTPDSVQAMIHGYKSFEFAKHQPENYRSPFWQAYRQCRAMLGEPIDGPETAVLTTNLFRMSLDGGSVMNGTNEDVNNILEASRNILLSEIRTLNPSAIVLFTGPRYENPLHEIFEGLTLEEFNGNNLSHIAKVAHNTLPERTWRTYHPGHLHYGKWHFFDEILDAIKKSST